MGLRGGAEGGVGHAEGAQDPVGEELVEALAGGHLDDAAEDIGGDRVVPFGPRLEQQREAGVEVADLSQVRATRRAPLEAARAVQRVDRVDPVEAVGEPGRVREQVPDPDWFGGGHGHLPAITVLIVMVCVIHSFCLCAQIKNPPAVGEWVWDLAYKCFKPPTRQNVA